MATQKADLVIRNASVFYAHRLSRVNLAIRTGKIIEVMDASVAGPEAAEIFDATGLYCFPGFIDPHVHFGLQLGAEQSSDDFTTGSVSAAFGGITSVFNFTPVLTGSEEDLTALFNETAQTAEKYRTQLFLHLAVAEPRIAPEKLVELAIRYKFRSVKVFTTYSSSGRMTSDGYLMDLLKASRGTPLVVMIHAENDSIIRYREKKLTNEGIVKPSHLPYLRPSISEVEAALRVCLMVSEMGGRIYLAHLSSGKTIDAIYRHFPALLGKSIFLETCPHYLYFSDTFLKGDQAAHFTTCPPLRSEEERQELLKHFFAGRIHTIGSDHCPFASWVKEKYKDDYLNMPNGLPGVELGFVLLYNLLKSKENEITVEELSRMFSSNIANVFGIFPQKGSLLPGADADLALFDPNAEWKVTLDALHGRNDYDPYEGLKLKGKIDSTIIGGKFVVRNKQWIPTHVQ
ncbi:MAG: amidohydrolase family protein [Thermotogaceae bacterium]|jgi:dihydropyrimidinase|nr:amidohydrolase family protein [Thermotogota bacterium]NLZ12710.1 amidohydrolase family protein [Thermotogaceae bacterium]HOZ11749.1 amidohydrolase family protein [Thermotogota bacterium]HPB87390.1 amidohydrolase family protein [Thermotogota bacterium]HPH09757.1 amidohydrolase family protein [Thermotogota bacterium]